MIWGYNTNGFSYHPLEDAVHILSELGYRAVGLTVDFFHLNPFHSTRQEIEAFAKLLKQHELRLVIETGSRFLLDPRRKHKPTLICPDANGRAKRLDFLCRCVDLAEFLQADAVSFWSGSGTTTEEESFRWLVAGCQSLADYAERKNVRLAFEPEPGMLIDTMDKYERLYQAVNHPSFGLTFDVGHAICLQEDPLTIIERWQRQLWNIHIEDMQPGVHDHLPFGQGVVPVADVLKKLCEVGYSRGVYVELSRQAHDAVRYARESISYLESVLVQSHA